MAKSVIAGQPAIVHSGCDSASVAVGLQDTTCNGAFSNLSGTTDRVPFPGNVAIGSAGVNAMTLVAPVPGPQPIGDDGKSVFLVSVNAVAHTVTTPANAIMGSKHLATFTAGIGNNIELRAFNGVWVVVTATGVTVT